MTKQQKLIALAKLDGWTDFVDNCGDQWGTPPDWNAQRYHPLINYLTNGDEIRRLIGKQSNEVLRKIYVTLPNSTRQFLATAEELGDVLLKATGNWVD